MRAQIATVLVKALDEGLLVVWHALPYVCRVRLWLLRMGGSEQHVAPTLRVIRGGRAA